MAFKHSMQRTIEELVDKVLQRRGIAMATQTGTVVSRSGQNATVVMGSSVVVVPVKVGRDVTAAAGDRVGLVRFDTTWVIVYAMTPTS